VIWFDSLTGLAPRLKEPRDLVMQAIGWLAALDKRVLGLTTMDGRDKVEILESGRTKTISLRHD